MLRICAADADNTSTRLGKVGASLPQEYELTELIKDIENPDSTWNINAPACQWNGVKIGERFMRGRPKSRTGKSSSSFFIDYHESVDINVKELLWSSMRLRGALRWQYLPRTLKYLELGNNQLSGSVSTTDLPPLILNFEVFSNFFTGNPCPTDFPRSVNVIELSGNKFDGYLHLLSLPPALTVLSLRSNYFSGFLNLAELPYSMVRLDLSKNRFVGDVNLENLPSNLSFLDLSDNTNLKGMYRPSALPKQMHIKEWRGLFSYTYTTNEAAFKTLHTLISVRET